MLWEGVPSESKPDYISCAYIIAERRVRTQDVTELTLELLL